MSAPAPWPSAPPTVPGRSMALGDVAEGGLYLLGQGGSGAEAAQQPASAQVVLDRFARVVVLPVAAQGEEGVVDTPGGAGLPPGVPDADLLQGHGRMLGVLVRRRWAGALPVAVAVLDGVAVGVADRMPVRVREDGNEPRLGAVPVQAFAERGDRVVRHMEQGGAHLGVHVEEISADGVEVGERTQFDGGRCGHGPSSRRGVLGPGLHGGTARRGGA